MDAKINEIDVAEQHFERNVTFLLDYYHQLNGLTLIGANDSIQAGLGKSVISDLSSLFEKGKCPCLTFDLGSANVNKTEHIDQMLTHNLTKEEIILAQACGWEAAAEKVSRDLSLHVFHGQKWPLKLAKVSKVMSLVYRPQEGDEKLFLTDRLKEAQEPTFIYSSGSNDLMREVRNYPSHLARDYKKQNENYRYSLKRYQDPTMMKKVVKGIEQNLDHILSINPGTDIYVLCPYTVKQLVRPGIVDDFGDYASRFNDLLIPVCDKYHVSYINLESLVEKHGRSLFDWHLTRNGRSKMTCLILDAMYQRKKAPSSPYVGETSIYPLDSMGPFGMIEDAMEGIAVFQKQRGQGTYSNEHIDDMIDENKRNSRTFEKVLGSSHRM